MLQRCITIVAGVSRSGKSTFALRYLLNADVSYRFVFDSEVGPQCYANRLHCDTAGDQYSLSLQLCQGWVLFDPHQMFPGRLADAFNFFCDWVFTLSQQLPGKKILVVDEAWKYVTQQRYPQELASCVQTGAAFGLQCMFNTQLPQKLNEAIRNECSELVCFRLNDDNCLKFVKEKGLDPEQVRQLPQLHFVSRNLDSGGELRGAIKV